MKERENKNISTYTDKRHTDALMCEILLLAFPHFSLFVLPPSFSPQNASPLKKEEEEKNRFLIWRTICESDGGRRRPLNCLYFPSPEV